MKKIMLLLTVLTINPMNVHSPRPMHAYQIHAQKRESQLPLELLARPATPSPDRSPTPPLLDYAIPISPAEVHVEEVRAHAQEVVALSKKKIACLVAASAITSAILTAGVTLTIHFTECQK